ncbi:hypothetical protein BIFGAL_03084 [Bifidobacterium gallicum DSM 20093 = LMG 11596]|uniref:Uncharacterized protein n=1 Tax=Bifidobacterium gallicum DSM 20093 = LMG 11596 TaxID=561180 RepID=D1NTC7_9BIFI|nr:hypothetical protein BIFGAL_03084 [Bifidobacterium gallicum DSM 20093 = LMG 11596]
MSLCEHPHCVIWRASWQRHHARHGAMYPDNRHGGMTPRPFAYFLKQAGKIGIIARKCHCFMRMFSVLVNQ